MADKPSLSELGLDGGPQSEVPKHSPAVCKFCGVRVKSPETECSACKEIRQTSSTASLTRKLPLETERAIPWLPITIAGAIVISLLLILAAITSDGSRGEPTYRDALQVLVDEVDGNLKANIFGEVTCKGSHAYVVLESDYFNRLDEAAKRLTLTSVRDQWVTRCHGTNLTFKKWDGTVVAEL